jgi:hypothetical protein
MYSRFSSVALQRASLPEVVPQGNNRWRLSEKWEKPRVRERECARGYPRADEADFVDSARELLFCFFIHYAMYLR